MNTTRRTLLALATALGALVVTAPDATAADSWSDPFPGIRLLKRTAPGPQVIHAAVVDISRPELYVRATRPGERARTTSSFANLVGAAVAINGDWFANGEPHGLAVGHGEYWPGTADNNWSFIACTVENDCMIDTSNMNRELHWSWFNVVGGNGVILAANGQALHNADPFYSSDRHPRSAVGISQDRRTLIFAVAQGRRGDSIGMTFNEMADLMVGLGAHEAMMLDGGGSSTLVVGGNRVNDLPAGAGERSVMNHLAVVGGIPDGRCEVASGRFCLDGTRIATCHGGGNYSDGDCAAFGASCEEGLGTAYCVHYLCSRGGNGSHCVDDATIATCEAGRYSEGDCSAFGASCEDDGTKAYCVHPFCKYGGNSTHCVDDTVLATCTDGAYSEGDCAAFGATCEDDGTKGYCVHPLCTMGGNAVWCIDEQTLGQCDTGAYEELPCPDGETCQPDGSGGAACAPPPMPASEDCINGTDDDDDGEVDCDDLDCATHEACIGTGEPPVADGTDVASPSDDVSRDVGASSGDASSPTADTGRDTSSADGNSAADMQLREPVDGDCSCRVARSSASSGSSSIGTGLGGAAALLFGVGFLALVRRRRARWRVE